MHREGFVTGDVEGLVAVAAQQVVQFVLGEPGQDGRVADLVAVEVEDRQHGPVADRVEELVRVPGGGERSGLGLAVTDDAGDQQPGVVEGGAVRVGERVAQFAALMDGAGDLGRHMARYPAGERELFEQPCHAVRVAGDVRVRLRVRALQPGVGEDGRAAVSGAPDAQGVQVPVPDGAIEVGVDKVQTG